MREGAERRGGGDLLEGLIIVFANIDPYFPLLCVCVRAHAQERESERERVCVCVCVWFGYMSVSV